MRLGWALNPLAPPQALSRGASSAVRCQQSRRATQASKDYEVKARQLDARHNSASSDPAAPFSLVLLALRSFGPGGAVRGIVVEGWGWRGIR